MNVKRNTPTQLIVENNPWFFAIIITFFALGMVVFSVTLMVQESILAGLFVLFVSAIIFPLTLYFIVQRVQIILDTNSQTMTIRRRTLRKYTEVKHDLKHLSHAEIDTYHDPKDGSKTHCPIFVLSGGMSAGRHPMTSTHQSGRGPGRIVRAVNTWLDAARQT